jgi:GTPase SAR1 family protein
MEYRHCPNLLIIDTPGMIRPPKGRNLSPVQRATAQKAREAEQLILNKIKVKDYLILCVEDSLDPVDSSTRNIVMQVDPDLSRTVLVTTKLDTKLPQFSTAEDTEKLLFAEPIETQFRHRLGGPFFTSIPSGRVGDGREFSTNDAFVSALKQQEKNDRTHVSTMLGGLKADNYLPNIGVSRLRSFLEQRVEESYRRNLGGILPKLNLELEASKQKLSEVDREIEALSLDKLQLAANAYREAFTKQLSDAIQGSIKLDPAKHGEAMGEEQRLGGAFLEETVVLTSSSSNGNNVAVVDLSAHVDNAGMKLYGGAQYYRALKEFCVAVRLMPSPVISADEIANAAGMGETNNGVNFMRAACVIAMSKAEHSFYPILDSLKKRNVHIMKRLFPIVEAMVVQSARSDASSRRLDMLSKPYTQLVRQIFERFVDQQVEETVAMCTKDLRALIEFVTWDTEDRGGGATRGLTAGSNGGGGGGGPITPGRIVQIWEIAEKKQRAKEQKQRESRVSAIATPKSRKVEEKGKKSVIGSKSTSSNTGFTLDDSLLFDQWKASNGGDDGGLVDTDRGDEVDQEVFEVVEQSSPASIDHDIERRAVWLTEQLLNTSPGERQTSQMINNIVGYIVT